MIDEHGGEPRRWLDDPDAPQELRADLEALRALQPPRLDEAAGLLALQQRIRATGGGGPGGGGGAAAAGGTAQAAVIAIGLATVFGLGSWLAIDRRPSPTTESPSPAAPTTVPAAPTVAPEAPRAEPAPSTPEVDLAPTGRADDDDAEDAIDRAETVAHPRLSPDDRLRREMELLDEARRNVDRDPRAALSALATARREVGSGTFDDEREALRALALFALHRDAEARPLAERILRRDPAGLYAARLRESVAPSPPHPSRPRGLP